MASSASESRKAGLEFDVDVTLGVPI